MAAVVMNYTHGAGVRAEGHKVGSAIQSPASPPVGWVGNGRGTTKASKDVRVWARRHRGPPAPARRPATSRLGAVCDRWPPGPGHPAVSPAAPRYEGRDERNSPTSHTSLVVRRTGLDGRYKTTPKPHPRLASILPDGRPPSPFGLLGPGGGSPSNSNLHPSEYIPRHHLR